MSESGSPFQLQLLGPFRLTERDGTRIDISSKRGQALIAMLAVSRSGERTRTWLQDHLWGSRAPEQAQASLRRELSTLRQAVNIKAEILCADHNRVWLDLSQLSVDSRDRGSAHAEFLEGFDLPGEEAFEDWLREERLRLTSHSEAVAHLSSPPKAVPDFSLRPSIAVLPFENQTPEPDNAYFAEGLSEDLIDRLARLRWLPVIARSSAFALGAKGLDAIAAGRALGARYVLEGRVKRSSFGLSLAALLSDTESNDVIWSNRIELPDELARDTLEQLLAGLTATVGISIDQQEQSRALAKPQSDLNVRELIWKGRWHLNRLSKEDAVAAKACFDEALRREPSSPEAVIQSTWAQFQALWTQRGTDEEIRSFRQMGQKCIIADHDDARGHLLAGIAELWLRQPLRAEALIRRSLDLNPSLSLAHGQMCSLNYLNDNPLAAIASAETALRLSPHDHNHFYLHGEKAVAHLMLGQHEDAVLHADQSIMLRQSYWYAHVTKINALARSGEQDAALRAKADLRTSVPQFDPAYADWLPFIDSKWNLFLREGLNL